MIFETCPTCAAVVHDPIACRGIRLNAIARVGGEIVDLRNRLDALKDRQVIARDLLRLQLEAAETLLQNLQAEIAPPPRAVVLYRDQGAFSGDAEEKAAIAQRFHQAPRKSRLEVRPGDLVIGRYSVIPLYRELEADVRALGGTLINSATQHEYIADIRNWYGDLQDLTPKTWFRLEDVDAPGPFVLKGGINSRKHDWQTHMFAAGWEEAGRVHARLSSDGLIGRQEIVIRRHVPLVTYGTLIGGLPITQEYRYFVADGCIVTSQFYWADFLEDAGLEVAPDPPPAVAPFVKQVIARIGAQGRFYTVDVGVQPDGQPILIELNDGQMAGLCGASAHTFYGNLAHVLGVDAPTERKA